MGKRTVAIHQNTYHPIMPSEARSITSAPSIKLKSQSVPLLRVDKHVHTNHITLESKTALPKPVNNILSKYLHLCVTFPTNKLVSEIHKHGNR